MEHLLVTYIRTKRLCGDKDKVFNDGTVCLTPKELSKLGNHLGMTLDDIKDMLSTLRQRGIIRGYKDNYKTTKKDGVTQPELLELTGEKIKRHRHGAGADCYIKRIQKGGGSRKFKEFLTSKPMDKFMK